VTQKGLANTQAALDWVVQQMASGGLSATLSELTVSGCSAGSVGAQLWGKAIAETLQWKEISVIPDSYAGIFPPGSEGPLIYNYGFCTAYFLTDASKASCLAQTLTLRELNKEAMSNAPSIPYAFIQSKTDIVQESFYVAIGATTPNTTAAITPEEFYADVTELFSDYNKYANFVTYLVDGDQHCFSPSDVFYSADPTGPKDNGMNSDSPMLYSWYNTMPLANGESVNTECDGQIEKSTQSIQKQNLKNSVTYCSDGVTPKSFVEQY
jgi:hypothetical protein